MGAPTREPGAAGAPLLVVRRLAPGASIQEHPPLLLPAWDGGPARLRTEARVGHDGERLVAHFRCEHDGLHVDPSLPLDASAEGLWEHDVVELFVSDRPSGVPYRELEASPLGQWVALAFDAPRVRAARPWRVRPEVRARTGEAGFEVSLAIALEALRTGAPGGGHEGEEDGLRLGLFRVHGPRHRREHQAWPPLAGTAPDFHAPAAWGRALLERGREPRARRPAV